MATADGATTTIKSRKHDVFQSTDFWPSVYDGRAVIGNSYEDFMNGVTDHEIIRRYKEAQEQNRSERQVVWS